EEFTATAYRVLAYLLLGVVRVYSKKVEYLVDDCHEVILQINEFVISKRNNTRIDSLCAPYHSITVPERFELDAFDLGITEDFSGDDVIPYKENMHKDGLCETEGIGICSLDKYHCEEFVDCHDTCSAYHTLIEDVCSSQSMDVDRETLTLQNLSNLVEKLQGDCFSRVECVNLEILGGVGKEPPDLVITVGDSHQTNGDNIEVPGRTQSAKPMVVEGSMEKAQDGWVSQEGCVNVEGDGGKPVDPIKLTGEDDQTDGEQIERSDEYHTLSSEQASIEKLQDHGFSQEECMDLEMFCGAETPEVSRPFVEEHHNDADQIKMPEMNLPKRTLSEMTSSKKKCQIVPGDNPVSLTLDATPQSKLSGALGASTPEFMVIHTPATKEDARISRKRKCLFDDVIVFPNDVLRQCIYDSSDLVSKGRKVPRTTLPVGRIYNLPQVFSEPFIPYISSELRSLFSKRSFQILKSIKTGESPKQLSVSESPIADRSSDKTAVSPVMTVSETSTTFRFLEHVAIAPETEVSETPAVGRSSEQIAIAPETDVAEAQTTDKSLEQMAISQSVKSKIPTVDRFLEQMTIAPERDVSKTPTVGVSSEHMSTGPDRNFSDAPCVGTSLERMAIAPETPVRHSALTRSFEIPESPKNLNSEQVRPENLYGSVEKELSLSMDQELDLNLINEEMSSCGGDNRELQGWSESERTRMLARYLNRSSGIQNKREVVDLLQLVEGRSKKESAALFYEVLVLKTKGFVDVKQDDPYGEILVWKLPLWDHI
ncbi:Rad21_Rec8 domain-containing protein/Rad21_Rec8_N domain-containing protein, partial [Cephalotus follicularis]